MSENKQASPNTAHNMGGGRALGTPELPGEGKSSTASHMHRSNAVRSVTMANGGGGGKEREMGNWHTERW